MRRLSRRGIAALVAAVCVVVAVIMEGPFHSVGAGSITVTAHFDNAAGLYVGNAVDVLGMRVGKVKTVKQDGDYVAVTVTIDKSTRIPANATAVIVSDSVLTDRHVEFTPPYAGGATLGDGAVLGLDRTKTPVEFDSVLAMADKLATSLGGNGAGQGPIAGLVDVGRDAVANKGGDIKSALGQLAAAMRMSGADRGAATKNAITNIVNNLAELTQTAARNDKQIRDFGTGVRELSDLLADQDLGGGDTGTELNQILAAATSLLQDNTGTMSSLISGGNVLTKSLSDYRDSIAEFMDDFPLVTDNAYAAVDQQIGAGRVHVNLDRVLLDGQMVKEACNLLNMKQLGCNTGKLSDMGPDFGLVSMLAGLAGAST